MKNTYVVKVSQYFDTYHEWTKVYDTANTLEEAEELKKQANKQYPNRPLVSYSISIIRKEGDIKDE